VEKVLVCELGVTGISVRSRERYLYFAKFPTSGKQLQALLREARPAE
jgi:hypothetical protein